MQLAGCQPGHRMGTARSVRLAGGLALMLSLLMATAGAPRNGHRYANLAGPRDLPGFQDMLPFLLRKACTTLMPLALPELIEPAGIAALAVYVNVLIPVEVIANVPLALEFVRPEMVTF